MSETRYVYIWEGGECEECSEMNGKEFYSEDEIDPTPPLHPNCNCYISVLEIDDNNNVKPSNYKLENAVKNTMKNEGDLTQNENRDDFPTNMGITQPTFNAYNKMHKKLNFPEKVDNLNYVQAKQIYKMMYWDKSRTEEIKNIRIREAVFDMLVMTGPKSAAQVQEALNNFGRNIKVDEIMGSNTINALNSISNQDVIYFMDELKKTRMEHLRNDSPVKWEENKNGWTTRTVKY